MGWGLLIQNGNLAAPYASLISNGRGNVSWNATAAAAWGRCRAAKR